MDEKFVVTPKTKRSVTMTIRIATEYNEKLEGVAAKSGRSRNELINMAIKFAFGHIEIEFVDSNSQRHNRF